MCVRAVAERTPLMQKIFTSECRQSLSAMLDANKRMEDEQKDKVVDRFFLDSCWLFVDWLVCYFLVGSCRKGCFCPGWWSHFIPFSFGQVREWNNWGMSYSFITSSFPSHPSILYQFYSSFPITTILYFFSLFLSFIHPLPPIHHSFFFSSCLLFFFCPTWPLASILPSLSIQVLMHLFLAFVNSLYYDIF